MIHPNVEHNYLLLLVSSLWEKIEGDTFRAATITQKSDEFESTSAQLSLSIRCRFEPERPNMWWSNHLYCNSYDSQKLAVCGNSISHIDQLLQMRLQIPQNTLWHNQFTNKTDMHKQEDAHWTRNLNRRKVLIEYGISRTVNHCIDFINQLEKPWLKNIFIQRHAKSASAQGKNQQIITKSTIINTPPYSMNPRSQNMEWTSPQ